MDVFTLLNEKGGVAKTTLAITLAAAATRDGRRVLLIDSDIIQCPTAAQKPL
jgi:cellulose biosynthesis protein BcsQ